LLVRWEAAAALEPQELLMVGLEHLTTLLVLQFFMAAAEAAVATIITQQDLVE
jgi:hypothetical protein